MKLLLTTLTLLFVTNQTLGHNNVDSLINVAHEKPAKEKIADYLLITEHYKNKNLDSAQYYLSIAKRIALNLNQPEYIVDCYNAEGLMQQANKNYEKSIEAYMNAVQIGEKEEIMSKIGSSYNGLGINYYYLKDFEKAKKYFKKAITAKKNNKQYEHIPTILTNLSGIYLFEGEVDKAANLLRPIEKTLIKAESHYALANLYTTFGGIHQMGYKNYDSAYYYYDKGLSIGLDKDIEDVIMVGYHNIGQIEIYRKNFKDAEKYLLKALKLSKVKKNQPFQLNAYSSLSELYEVKNEHDKALEYKKRELELNTSIFQREKQEIIENLEIKYQTTKKEEKIKTQNIALQKQKLKIEQEKNKRNQLLFIVVTTFLTTGFVVLYLLLKKKAREKIEKQKNEIFHNIVHEIRTPLTLITGPLQILKAQEKNKPEIQRIEKNANKLVNLVNELLNASKLEKGKFDIQYKIGNIYQFTQSIVQSFEEEIHQKNIQLNYMFNPNQSYNAEFPYNVVEIAVSNFISNAIKHTPKNGTIGVDVSHKKGKFNISVSNSGSEISKKEQNKIFDRFYRTPSSKNLTGTGIGLSLVKDIVLLTQGTIDLKSEDNVTTFSIDLPIKEISQSSSAIENDESEKFKILIAEDDHDLTIFLHEIFDDHFEIHLAGDGEQAIEMIETIIPDVILTDLMMPRKDGIEVLKHCKTNKLTQHIPIVVFTSRTSLEDKIKTLQVGADAYIPKPFDVSEIKLTVENLVKTIKKNQKAIQEEIDSNLTFDKRIEFKDAFVSSCAELIINNIDNNLYSVNELASDMNISRSQLHRKIKAITGYTSSYFIRKIRLEKAKDLIISGHYNITEAAYECGFSSQSYFTKCFTEEFGQSPTSFLPK